MAKTIALGHSATKPVSSLKHCDVETMLKQNVCRAKTSKSSAHDAYTDRSGLESCSA